MTNGIVNDPKIKPVPLRRAPHTPGPWYAWDNGATCGVGKDYGNQADLFSVEPSADSNRPFVENLANMRLASVSPEMYTVLKSMGEMLRVVDPDGYVVIHMSPVQAQRIIDLIDHVEAQP